MATVVNMKKPATKNFAELDNGDIFIDTENNYCMKIYISYRENCIPETIKWIPNTVDLETGHTYYLQETEGVIPLNAITLES